MSEAQMKDQLDKLIVKNLTLIEEILEEKRSLEVSLRDGFFLISKARYSMGSKSVGSLQLPTEDGMREIEALMTVDDRETDDVDAAVKYRDFFVVVETSPARNDDPGLRKRIVKKEEEESKEMMVTFDKKTDPLKWFGVLVPRALRESQRVFQENIGSICRIASLQSHLEAVRKEYEKISQQMNEQMKS